MFTCINILRHFDPFIYFTIDLKDIGHWIGSGYVLFSNYAVNIILGRIVRVSVTMKADKKAWVFTSFELLRNFDQLMNLIIRLKGIGLGKDVWYLLTTQLILNNP